MLNPITDSFSGAIYEALRPFVLPTPSDSCLGGSVKLLINTAFLPIFAVAGIVEECVRIVLVLLARVWAFAASVCCFSAVESIEQNLVEPLRQGVTINFIATVGYFQDFYKQLAY